MSEKPRVLIAVPTYETISPDTFESIWNLDKRRIEAVDFKFVRGYDCAKARNDIGKIVQNGEWTHVLMVDSDVVVPVHALRQMLEHDVDVCLGYYQRKSGPDGATTLCEIGRTNYDASIFYDELAEMRDDGRHLVEVKGGGLGCALIKSRVFDVLPFPWFRYDVRADGSVLSEDYHFCTLCRRNGITVNADPRVSCGHRIAKVRWADEQGGSR